jgi:hypothetical protein
MALRFLLVSLVAGLGVNLPSGDELTSWASSGREWVQARIDGFRGIESDSSRETEQADAEFAAVVDEMAGTFSDDLASMDRPSPATQIASVSLEVAEDEIVENEPVDDRPEPVAATVEIATDDEDISEPTVSTGAARSARIASAVQLTRQAADAWISVLRNDEARDLGQ